MRCFSDQVLNTDSSVDSSVVVLAADGNKTLLLSGSVAELPNRYVFENFTDVDVMKIPRDMCAVDANRNWKIRKHGTRNENTQKLLRRHTLVIENSYKHPCFVKLWSRKYHRYLPKPSIKLLRPRENETPKGPSWKRCLINGVTHRNSSLWHKLKKLGLFELYETFTNSTRDEVFAIECPMWPFAAKEWLSRKRDNEWPSETCIGRIAGGGCHLVAKPHELNFGDDTEWRYSFSKGRNYSNQYLEC